MTAAHTADHGRSGLSEDEREAIELAINEPLAGYSNASFLIPCIESILASRMADAWDEGMDHGFYIATNEYAPRDAANPYKRQP